MKRFSIFSLIRERTVNNAIWIYVLQFFNTIVPLLTIPYVTRVIGTEMYGEFSIALNLVLYLQVIVEYGFIMSATRQLVLIQDDVQKINILFSRVMVCRGILLAICFFIYITYINVSNKNYLHYCCIIVLMTTLIGYCTQQNWFFQGVQDMKYISIISIVSRVISVLLIFILVKKPSQILLYCVLYSITPVLNGIIGTIIVIKKYKVRLVKLTIDEIIEGFISGWHVFLTQFSSKIFVNVGVTILGLYVSSSIVGIYSAIQKIPSIIVMVWSPISQVLFPISSKRFSMSFCEGKKFIINVARIVLPIFSIIIITICLFARHVVCFAFGNQYVSGYHWVIPLCIWILVAIMNNFLGIQTLLASGHDSEYGHCFLIGVVVTILVNYVFIFRGGADGASFAPLVSESILTLMLFCQIYKISKREEYEKQENNGSLWHKTRSN